MAVAPPPQRPQQGVAARMITSRPQQPLAPPPRPQVQAVSPRPQPPNAAPMVGAASGRSMHVPFFTGGSFGGMVMTPPVMPLQRPSLMYGPPAYVPYQFQPPPMVSFNNLGYPNYQQFQQPAAAAGTQDPRPKRKKDKRGKPGEVAQLPKPTAQHLVQPQSM
ncbi:hypothetical protein ZWY2020_058189 [Hordeum vulgare]|nr:hypothetical protein ZWY2020_058189 [Hordeum vulgare]